MTKVVFNAFRERYHKLAGGALGLDRGEEIAELRQRLSQEETHCAHLPASRLFCSFSAILLLRWCFSG